MPTMQGKQTVKNHTADDDDDDKIKAGRRQTTTVQAMIQ